MHFRALWSAVNHFGDRTVATANGRATILPSMEDAELSITVEDARKRIAEHQREGGGFQVRTRTVQYIYNEDLQEIRVGGEVFLTSPFRETNAWNQDGHDDDFIGVLQMHPGKLSQKERKAFDCAETVTKEILLRRNHIVKALNVRKTFLQRMLSIFRHSPVLTEQEKSSVLSQVQAAIM